MVRVRYSPISLNISPETWEKFKKIVPPSLPLNKAIVQLIEDKIEEELKNEQPN